MNHQQGQPDWDKLAEKFDTWLPQLAPVGAAMIAALDAQPGEKILDVASGTGEPALSLATGSGAHAQITATDAAEGMVRVAQKKAENRRLRNLHFEVMPAEQLRYKDGAFDKAICRFGVMLFQDPLQGVKEMYRVLKPGGRAVIAVWGPPEKVRTMYWMQQALKNKLPEGLHPPIGKATSLGQDGALRDLLHKAGFQGIHIELHTLHYHFASFDAYWTAMEASEFLKQQYDAMSAADRTRFRDEIAEFARDFIGSHGFRVPHEWWLAMAHK